MITSKRQTIQFQRRIINAIKNEPQEELVMSDADIKDKTEEHTDDAKLHIKKSLTLAIQASKTHTSPQQRRHTKDATDDVHRAELHNIQEIAHQFVKKTSRTTPRLKRKKKRIIERPMNLPS